MKVFHFRPYTLHLGRYELSRGASILPLPRIAMEILILLVERRGDLLTRREIAARVWPGSDPEDVFQSINTAINRIRYTLRDEASNPKYVQTVIGKGYRLVAAVEEMDLVEEVSAAASVSEAWIAPVGAFPSAAAHAEDLPPSSPSISIAAAPPLPLEPRSAVPAPAASLRTLARVQPWMRWPWAAAAVLLLASLATWGLWQHAAASTEHRGAFRLVQFTDSGADEPVTAGAISPDGKSLAYANRHGVLLRDLGGAVLSLRTPGLVDVGRIEWFPDGRRILVSATVSSTHNPQIWSVSAGEDAPRLVRDGARLGIPSPDGSRIAFTTVGDTGITTFWIADADGRNETRVDVGPPGGLYPVLLWSADARKLILEEVSPPPPATSPAKEAAQSEERPSHRLVVLDIETHLKTAAVNGMAFGAACLWGKTGLLFTGSVNDPRLTGLWKVDLDPDTGAPLAAPVQVQLVENALALSRSKDGREVAAVFSRTQPDVYVATLSQPGPSLTGVKRITFGTGQKYPQAWTPDSRSVVFESNESGKLGIPFHTYRQAVDGPPQAEPLVSAPLLQVFPQQSPDGRWVLFASKSRWLSQEPYALYRVAEPGGAPVKIDIGGPLDEYRCPLFGHGCVLRETEGHAAFHYYELDPVAGKGRLLCSTPWTETLIWDWSVSPDGREIALPVLDPARPRIRVVPCTGGTMAGKTREVPVKIGQRLMEATWAADGRSWFVSAAATPKGADLFHVRLDGSATFLRHDDPLWGVPSPDGRKLAFVGETVDSNVWLLR